MKTQFTLIASIILISFGLLGVMSKPEQSREERIEQLFENYYKLSIKYTHDELTIYDSSRCPGGHDENSEERMARRDAKIMYNTGEYQLAAAAMSEILKESPDDVMFPYYLGRTYLKLNQLDSAQIHFEHIYKYPTSLYFEETEWFYALTLLKKQDIPRCKTLLKKIHKNKKHYYIDVAIPLNEDLDKEFRSATQRPA